MSREELVSAAVVLLQRPGLTTERAIDVLCRTFDVDKRVADAAVAAARERMRTDTT